MRLKQSKTLTVPGDKSKYVIALKPGSADDRRNLELVDHAAIDYSAQRNCYLTTTGNYRVLNWLIECSSTMLYVHRLTPPGYEGSFTDTASPPYGYVRYQDVAPWLLQGLPEKNVSGPFYFVGLGAMTFIDDTRIAYIRAVSMDDQRRVLSWGYSELDLETGVRRDQSEEFRSHLDPSIGSMYYVVPASELVILSTDKSTIHVYSGSPLPLPEGSHRSFTISPSIYRYIDVLDGDLVAAGTQSSTLVYTRFDGISNRVLSTINATLASPGWLAGITHLGEQIILRQISGDSDIALSLLQGHRLVKISEFKGGANASGNTPRWWRFASLPGDTRLFLFF